jgi:hypothetical protein
LALKLSKLRFQPKRQLHNPKNPMRTVMAAQICDARFNPGFLPVSEAARHRANPLNTKPTATMGAIFGQEGRILLRKGTLSHQPVNTTTPPINTQPLAILATDRGHPEYSAAFTKILVQVVRED